MILLAIALLILFEASALANLASERDLRKRLLSDYDQHIRPENLDPNGSGTQVYAMLLPFYLEDIRETEGVALLYFDVDLKWNDSRLMWDKRAAPKLPECIFFEMREIWTPYLRFKNTLAQIEEKSSGYPIRVCENGLVHLFYTTKVKSSGQFDIRRFPYDSQEILVHFAHPSAGIQELHLHYSKEINDTSNYQMETIIEWNFESFFCEEGVMASLDVTYQQTHSYITCRLVVKRNPRYYIFNFCIPSAAVTFLAILGTHSATTLTGPRTTKYQLGLMAMMATSVLTLSIVEMLPRSEQISRLHIFYFGLIATIVSSTCSSWLAMVWERKRGLAVQRSHETRRLLENGKCSGRRKSIYVYSSSVSLDLISACIHLAFLLCLVTWFCVDI